MRPTWLSRLRRFVVLPRASLACVALAGLAAGMVGCKNNVVTPPVTNADHTVTLKWSQNEADNPPCSATVTKSCLSGYTEGFVFGGTTTALHSDDMSVCTGTTEPLSCTTTFQTAALPIGTVNFSLVLNYVDGNGAAQSLAAVTTGTATTVAADAPTSFSATVN